MQPAWSLAELAGAGFMSQGMRRFLEHLVNARFNIVIGGGAGSGKTTLLTALCGLFHPEERAAVFDEAVRTRAILKQAIRARPDRIVADELRGPEAFDMLQSLEDGIGWLASIKSQTARDMVNRLEWMALEASLGLRAPDVRRRIAGGIQFLVRTGRLSDGSRRVCSITEVVGMEGEIIALQDIFFFEKRGISPEGLVRGRFKASGIRPKAWETLLSAGIRLDRELFEEVQEV